MLPPSGSKLLFIGDSITDCDRARPLGERGPTALGRGYVALVDALLAVHHPDRIYRVVNKGNSGDNIRDLAARWEEDALAPSPDLLSVMVGINDLSRAFTRPQIREEIVPIGEFERTYSRLLTKASKSVRRLVLMTPFVVETNPADPLRVETVRFAEAVARLARKHKAILVDSQAAIDALLTHRHPLNLAADRVHPYPAGHLALALAWLRGRRLRTLACG